MVRLNFSIFCYQVEMGIGYSRRDINKLISLAKILEFEFELIKAPGSCLFIKIYSCSCEACMPKRVFFLIIKLGMYLFTYIWN